VVCIITNDWTIFCRHVHWRKTRKEDPQDLNENLSILES